MVVAIGALIGMVNGFFVAKFSLHPFIVTLATQLITYGLILIFFMLNGNNGQPVSGLSQEYKNVVSAPMLQFVTGSGAKISIPWYVLYAVIFVALMWFIWNKTAFGKNMFAVGSNADAAKVSGVNVFWTTVMVHTLAGAMYGVTGFIEGARISSITQSAGLNYECDAIAACVIGGVSFVGGTGKISGIVLGVFVLRIIFVALSMLGIDPSMQYIIKGGIILAACSLDMRKYLAKSKSCVTMAADGIHLPPLQRKETAETIIGSLWNRHKEHPHGYDNGNCLGGAGFAAGLREKLRPSPSAGRDVCEKYDSF